MKPGVGGIWIEEITKWKIPNSKMENSKTFPELAGFKN
jgi:hypothetical protein